MLIARIRVLRASKNKKNTRVYKRLFIIKSRECATSLKAKGGGGDNEMLEISCLGTYIYYTYMYMYECA